MPRDRTRGLQSDGRPMMRSQAERLEIGAIRTLQHRLTRCTENAFEAAFIEVFHT